MKYLFKFAVTLCLGCVTAAAHHSAVMYDMQHLQTLDTTVKAFNWTNPHTTLELLVVSKPDAAPTLWTVEMSSTGVLTRAGWSKRSFNPGDHVTVEFAPLKDGRTGGLFRKATFPDGKVLTWSFKPGEQPGLE